MFAELGGGIHVGKRTGHDSRWELHVGRAVFLIKSARKPILGISNVSDDNADLLKRHAIDCQTSLQVGALTRPRPKFLLTLEETFAVPHLVRR